MALSNRGIALLVCLFALVVLTLAAAPLLVSAQHRAIRDRMAIDDDTHETVVEGLGPLLIGWLDANASGWPDVLFQFEENPEKPPTMAHQPHEPLVIHDWAHEGFRVRVQAIDLQARLHVAHSSGSPENLLPLWVQDIRQSTAHHTDIAWIPVSLLSQAASVPAFPGPPEASDEESILDWLTTHSDGELNIRTARLDLLESALEGLNDHRAQRLLAARRLDSPADLSAVQGLITERHAQIRDDHEGNHLPLTSSSRVFGFLIDTVINGAQERTWLVASSDPDRALNRRQRTSVWRWTRVERIEP